MATRRQIDSAAKPEPKPVVGGAVFGLDQAVLHDARVNAECSHWARRCCRRHAKDAADYALLCGALGITP